MSSKKMLQEDEVILQRATPAFATVPARAVLDTRLTNAQMRVLVTMCLHANARHVCWPKVETLASEIGVTKQAVSKTIHELAHLGYVEIGHYGFPRHNIYRVDYSPPGPIDPTLDAGELDEEDVFAATSEPVSQLHSQPHVDPGAEDAHSQPHVDHTVNLTLTNSQPHVDQQSTQLVDCRTDHRTDHTNKKKRTEDVSLSQTPREEPEPDEPPLAVFHALYPDVTAFARKTGRRWYTTARENADTKDAYWVAENAARAAQVAWERDRAAHTPRATAPTPTGVATAH